MHEAQLEKVKEQLELTKLFNATSSLTRFEIQKYFENKAKFNGNNKAKVKDGRCAISLMNQYESVGTH